MKFRMPILFFIAALFISCGGVKEQFSSEMLQQISMLPQDAQVIGYINLHRMQQSPLKSLLPDSGKIEPFHDPEYREFFRATEFDLQKDVREVYFAVNFDAENHEGAALVIASGRFKPEKIMSYVSAQNDNRITHEKVDDYDFYYFDEDSACICFPDSGTLVGGKPEMVKQWLKQGKPPAQQVIVAADMQQRLRRIKYKNTCWICADFSKSNEFIRNTTDEFKKFTEGIMNFTFSAQTDENLSVYGECECYDSEKAGLLKDALKGGIAALKLAESDRRDVIDTLNKVHIRTESKNVLGYFSLTGEDLERLYNIHKNEQRVTL